MRRIQFLLLVLLIAAPACGGMFQRRDLATSPPDPSSAVLVVTANLEELFDEADLADTSDVELFVDRLGASVPSAPDVLLLQEVTDATTTELVRLLHAEFDTRFEVSFSPGDRIFGLGDGRVMNEIGILVNARTMRVLDARSIPHRYPWSETGDGVVTRDRKTGVAHLKKKDGPRMTVASLHYPPGRNFADTDIAEANRERWSATVVEELREYPGLHVIAGDFNSVRCLNHLWYDCEVAPFYSTLTTGRMTDAWHEFKERVGRRRIKADPGVDFIFTDGYVWDYESDEDYLKPEEGTPDYYSDHRFRWALIGRPASD